MKSNIDENFNIQAGDGAGAKAGIGIKSDEIRIVARGGFKITAADGKMSFVVDSDGKLSIETQGEISVKSGGNVSLDAGGSDFTINNTSGVSVASTGKVDVSGETINVIPNSPLGEVNIGKELPGAGAIGIGNLQAVVKGDGLKEFLFLGPGGAVSSASLLGYILEGNPIGDLAGIPIVPHQLFTTLLEGLATLYDVSVVSQSNKAT